MTVSPFVRLCACDENCVTNVVLKLRHRIPWILYKAAPWSKFFFIDFWLNLLSSGLVFSFFQNFWDSHILQFLHGIVQNFVYEIHIRSKNIDLIHVHIFYLKMMLCCFFYNYCDSQISVSITRKCTKINAWKYY